MDIYEQFERELRLRHYAYNTIENYSSCLKTFISKAGANPSLEQIKSFLLNIKATNYHKQYVAVIHHYFKIILKEPISLNDIPYPRKTHYLPDVLSQEEVGIMFSACENEKHKAILALLYGCGLRVSEVINLKPEHINSKRMVVKVVQGKGNKDRYVKLPQELLDILRVYFKKYNPKTYLFNGVGCIQYSQRSVGALVASLAKKAGIKKRVHPHLLRHCYGTHLVEMGTDTALIQKAMGHKNRRTTLIYTQISKAVIANMPSPLNLLSFN